MGRVISVLFGLMILAAPGAVSAQSAIAPPVVQSMSDPAEPARYGPWIGAIAGTTAAVVGVNAWTGGALLAPSVGPALSGVLGGSWLGLSALTPLGAQAAFVTTSLVSVGLAGGVFGYWLGDR